MPIITIDGNIGAGKSSVMEYIHSKYRIPINVEPINVWQPFLEDLYGNKEAACFNMQVRVWLDRCDITLPVPTHNQLTERSPYFQRGVFIKVAKSNDSISENQYNMLNEMYDRTDAKWEPICYVYLRSNPDNCVARVQKRSRSSEDAISAEYLHQLHTLHEETYDRATSQCKNVIRVDVENKTIAQIGDEVLSAISHTMNICGVVL